MKELEDQRWFPAMLRNYQTEFIGSVVVWLRVYVPVTRRLRQRLGKPVPMVDLCSGSGGPAITIYRESGAFSSLTLTDKFPGSPQPPNAPWSYVQEPVDALDLEPERGTCYTMFNAFHHFSDQDKLRIIRRLRDSGCEACFVELLEPTVLCALKVILMGTMGTLLFTPFVRPFSLGRLFFTYIVPVNVVSITYDGVVSVLRARSATRYAALFAGEDGAVQVTRLAGRILPLTLITLRAR
ncbi:MAG TPA: class I SAM-dependent methyltransferase [Flavobacteriales bacterium]|nr:class I SAM-dependent methyltransferase [Flavobacteriales bacterium]